MLYNGAHSRSFLIHLNNSTLHVLLNSILIAEAIMALLRLTLFLTILLSVGQTPRQTDAEESKNVSCPFVIPSVIDLAHSAEDCWIDDVVLDRRTLYLPSHFFFPTPETSCPFNLGRTPRTCKRSSLSGSRNKTNRIANSATRKTSWRSSTSSIKETNRLAD